MLSSLLLACICSTVLVSVCVKPVFALSLSEELAHGESCLSQGNITEAKRQYLTIVLRDPNCGEAQIGLGRTYLSEGDYKSAEDYLKRALKSKSNDANLLNDLGNAAYRQEHYDDAISYFNKALENSGPDSYKVQTNLGNAYSDAHRLDEAVKHFAAAIALKNDFAPAYNGLSKMYFDNGHYEEAAEKAREAIAHKPDYATAYYHLGLSLAYLKKIPEAKEALEQSLKYEKSQQYAGDTRRIIANLSAGIVPSARRNAGTGSHYEPALIEKMLKGKQWAQAQGAIEVALKQGGDGDPLLWNSLGFSLMHQPGGYQAAKKAFTQALSLRHGNFAEANYNMGQLLRLMNDNAGAEKAFRAAIDNGKANHTPNPLVQNALGLMLKEKGDYKAADSAYKRAIMQSGVELPVVHYNRAILLEHMDNTREAVQEYKAYLALAPRGLNVKQAEVRLKRLGIE
jgi:tetratricopeptide (TPR) repeat protein